MSPFVFGNLLKKIITWEVYIFPPFISIVSVTKGKKNLKFIIPYFYIYPLFEFIKNVSKSIKDIY